MSKHFLTSIALVLFATGFVWCSLAVSLVVAFRYAAYVLPFVILTFFCWIYDVEVYVYTLYALLTAILVIFAYVRSYFRFSV